jgi:hypothetical protein
MRRIAGRCQRGIRYALWTLGEATTMEILEYCYPWPGEDRRQRKNRARAVCLAAGKMAIVVGGRGPAATYGGSRTPSRKHNRRPIRRLTLGKKEIIVR